MTLLSDIGNPIAGLSVIVLGFLTLVLLGRKLGTPVRRVWLLYMWHSTFCLLYAVNVLQNGGDAVVYYIRAANDDYTPGFGTHAVITIVAAGIRAFDLSFISTSLLFNVFGSAGLLIFDATLRRVAAASRDARRWASLMIFMPSISFWSSGIGKDSISFMGVCVALWAAQKLRGRVMHMAAAVLIVLIVRPHIAGMMMLALTMAIIVQNRTSLLLRGVLGASAVVISTVLVPLALNYAGVGENADVDELVAYTAERQSYNQHGGGAVDISSMSFPMQLLTYMFRPLPFEAHSLFAFAASLDNVLLIVLIALAIRGLARFRGATQGEDLTFIWIYALMTWAVLAVTTANIGISVRQKWMFAPMLIFLSIEVISRRTVKTARMPLRRFSPLRSTPFDIRKR